MKILHHIYAVLALVWLASCTEGDVVDEQAGTHELVLTTEVRPFSGEASGRGNLDGTGFEDGDWIRLKVICPFSDSSEYGESTYGNSYDAFYLMKRSGGSWTYLTTADNCDINGTYYPGNSPQLNSISEAQQTPYVYMASTWTEEKNFRAGPQGNTHVIQYCHVFHADQRNIRNYKASDLLWAQQYMQTGSWNVHLSFSHKMSCLTFEVDDSELTRPNPDYDPEDPASSPTIASPISSNAVLAIEGMPDIDQQEIIVGDYYAARSKINSNSGRFGYRSKHSCKYEHNGKVIGIGVNLDETYNGVPGNDSYAWPMTGNPNPANTRTFPSYIPNTGTYVAYKVDDRHFRVIVPPCVLENNASIWVRDGERRFKMTLLRKEFHEGVLYPVTVTLKNPQ